MYATGAWPNTGIGRINLDGSRGSCSPCHGRHEFSRARARDAEGCARCHRGPRHAQHEIYRASKHATALAAPHALSTGPQEAASGRRDLHRQPAPTCATCHLSGQPRGGEAITHDPARRIAWNHRGAVSLRMDTDEQQRVVSDGGPAAVADSWQQKRQRMRRGCLECHGPDGVDGFFATYDAVIEQYNEDLGRPGQALLAVLRTQGLVTVEPWDDPIEHSWFQLWHADGRRLRHAAAMMAPAELDARGFSSATERFRRELVGAARALASGAAAEGREQAAKAVDDALAEVRLACPNNDTGCARLRAR